jgi:transcription elongation factor Elf1
MRDDDLTPFEKQLDNRFNCPRCGGDGINNKTYWINRPPKCSKCNGTGIYPPPETTEITKEAADKISDYLDKAAEGPNLEVADEIWFKRKGENRVFHLYVSEIKDNVFKTSSSEEGAKRYKATANYSWWEFDNVRIIEIEKHES